MPLEFGIWRIDDGLERIDFRPMNYEARLQDILDKDITIASPNWMVVGREVMTDLGHRADLLAIDGGGNLIVIELKRNATPRNIVAQVLEYGSWAQNLDNQKIAEIFDGYVTRYHPEWDNISIDDKFRERFGLSEMPDELNDSHQLVIVAASLDPSTERIVGYLAGTYNVEINVILFQVFKDEQREYLSRAWLIDPATGPTDSVSKSRSSSEKWNGEFYVNFGESDNRTWNDAVKYGFISAGGGEWYTRSLAMLEPGNRIWVNIPGKGYAGVGEVLDSVVRFDEFLVEVNGQPIPISKAPVDARDMFDKVHSEHMVKVRWLKTLPIKNAIREKGFFGNQNTAAKPTSQTWRHTVERLKKRFEIEESVN
jgi:hypothetical protein